MVSANNMDYLLYFPKVLLTAPKSFLSAWRTKNKVCVTKNTSYKNYIWSSTFSSNSVEYPIDVCLEFWSFGPK